MGDDAFSELAKPIEIGSTNHQIRTVGPEFVEVVSSVAW